MTANNWHDVEVYVVCV